MRTSTRSKTSWCLSVKLRPQRPGRNLKQMPQQLAKQMIAEGPSSTASSAMTASHALELVGRTAALMAVTLPQKSQSPKALMTRSRELTPPRPSQMSGSSRTTMHTLKLALVRIAPARHGSDGIKMLALSVTRLSLRPGARLMSTGQRRGHGRPMETL